MSTHKHFEKICCVFLAIAILLTLLFFNAEKIGVVEASKVMGYENRLFDNSKVHSIDIVMNNWDEFIDNATSEEYYTASLVIDGEAYKNVAIRGKGNTSLSTVSSLGSERYSFKVEFDHYDNAMTYHGLDKLSLNNLIQDSTMMKDYLTYTMMNEFDTASPLCSFVYITVNGEDWGLYLAVEGIEDSFLQRNYGSNFGELYKPDSMSFGGGRGNGKDFNAEDFDFSGLMNNFQPSNDNTQDNSQSSFTDKFPNMQNFPNMSEIPDMTKIPNSDSFPNMENFGGMNGMNIPDMEAAPDMSGFGNAGEMPNIGTMPDMSEIPDFSGGQTNFGDSANNNQSRPQRENSESNEKSETSNDSSFSNKGFMNFGGGFGMGSSDVKLQYIDDNFDSYSNIWNNAKTDITDADKKRLIESLKKLSNGEDIENTVDIEQVIRYIVVHNYVCNGDSYTGSMIHNYYLYEEDGQLSMLPWDYNLAFGTFSGGSNGNSTVNTPIDSPVSGSSDDRPMLNWIFESEEYTELYHQLFSEFISNVDIQGIIDNAYNLIKSYVEKDPTAFYSYEEFEKGVATLSTFCKLRSESIALQLENNETVNNMNYVDASSINLFEMGSMGGSKGGMGGVNMMFPTGNTESGSFKPDNNSNNSDSITNSDESNGSTTPDSSSRPSRSDSNSSKFDSFRNMPTDIMQGTGFGSTNINSTFNISNIILLIASVCILIFGLLFAIFYKRRK